ncbi:MAG: AhpC/TSA family protein [Solirubrobacterales bacterium]|nr:AhpC/TSA family protein [Solirubrobacterales bacterium]MBV9717549.1 AhpC/TSA family protein [Solirubrobacterales bacterium]
MITPPSYAEQRDEMNQAIASQAQAEQLDGFAAAARRLSAIDFASRAPQVGDQAPDFVLPDQNGDEVYLSALVRRGPVVLIFYRGEWCPYCNLQLRTFQARLEEIGSRGAQLVAISPQTPGHSLSMAGKNALAFRVLSDVGADVIDRYGLRYEVDAYTRALLESAATDVAAHNGPGGWVLPATATFVIGSDAKVSYARVTGDWTERAEPSEVLAVLDELI